MFYGPFFWGIVQVQMVVSCDIFHDVGPFKATHCATFETLTPAANCPWLAMLGRGWIQSFQIAFHV